MDQFAREFNGRAHFLFIYAREAHPDSFPQYPAHRSIEHKWRHALTSSGVFRARARSWLMASTGRCTASTVDGPI